MVKWRELDQAGGFLVRAIERARAQEPARVGVHCSTIVNDILKTMDPKTYAQEFEAETSLLFQDLGNAFEDRMALYLRAVDPTWEKPKPRQGPQSIWGSPDGWSRRGQTIDEIKLTWKSEREFQSSLKFFGYEIQSLFYADVWGAERIRLHICFVNGGGREKYAFGPASHTYYARPTKAEKQVNTTMLLQHAKDRGILADERTRA